MKRIGLRVIPKVLVGAVAGLAMMGNVGAAGRTDFPARYVARAGDSAFAQTLRREGCASFLVVARLRIIHDVVKPQRQFDCDRLFRHVPGLVEFCEALGNVLLIMIMALRLGVGVR